jgi:hypothetical protein
MKHKTIELTGALLNAAVLKALPPDPRWVQAWVGTPHFSTEWAIAGPIIERERITVQAAQDGDWRAFLGDGTTNAGTVRSAREPMVQTRGPTPLVAAMRAYVASKLGDEVELP